MLPVIIILSVLSLVLAVVLAIYFVKTYGVKLTAMWGGVMILYVVLQILMTLCVLFAYEGRFDEEIRKREEKSGQLVHNIDEMKDRMGDLSERVLQRVQAYGQQIRDLQAWIDYFEDELEEIRQELGIEYESEPQS